MPADEAKTTADDGAERKPIRRVLVLGAGTLGTEVAAQCAAHGFDVALYDVAQPALEAARERLQTMLREHVRLGNLTADEGARSLARIQFTADAQQAAQQVDLISECVTENLKIKREALAQFSALCAPPAIITSNSSYFVPSMMARSVAAPQRFAALHFHVPVWIANVVDIMPHPETSPEVVARLRAFAQQIHQTPIVARIENHGYVFNAMLREFLSTAVSLAARGVADVEDIDRAWMGVTKMPIGPFGMIDTIGLETVHDIVTFWGAAMKDAQSKANAAWLKQQVEAGRKGQRSGLGFYRYPNPAYARPDFLQPTQHAPDRESQPAPAETVEPAATTPRPKPETPPENAGATAGAAQLPAAKDQTHTIQRWTVTFEPATDLPDECPQLLGAVLLVGRGGACDALAERLQAVAGNKVLRAPKYETADAAAAWAHGVFSQHDVPHLVLLTGLEPEGVTLLSAHSARLRTEQGLLIPWAICRAWYQQRLERGLLDRSTLLAGVMLGGSFGLTPPVVAAEGGALAGLIKATFMEGIASGVTGVGKAGVYGPQARIVDFSGNQGSDVIASQLARELNALRRQCELPVADPADVLNRYAELEVGYRRGCRQRLRMRKLPLMEGAERHRPQAGEVWVATGGARGITARVAAELGRQFGVKLHLLGTSACPEENLAALDSASLNKRKEEIMKSAHQRGEKPNVAWDRAARGIEIQRTLQNLEAAGVAATYHVCDIGDAAALERVLAVVRAQDGPIHGILHGAGVEITGRFDRKPLADVERTLRPKFAGTLALMELTQNEPLRWFVAFGSLSGRFGGVGQTDYAMANDALAKLVDWFRARRPECRACTIHWPGWEETGMAARPASRFSLGRVGHLMLPPAEGVRLLVAELVAGAPDAEVAFIAEDEIPAPVRQQAS